jgi:DNA-binding LacI/PurR family transcriptional regulator
MALREEGLRVPKDVSVLGFDDVLIALTNNPPLTTIHQPLHAMGQAAASTLLQLIREETPRSNSTAIKVHPKLVVRKSTGPAPSSQPSIVASQDEEAGVARPLPGD